MFNSNCSTQGHLVKILRTQFFKSLFISLAVISLVCFFAPTHVYAATDNGTTTGTINLTPTIENVGVIIYFTGDANNNNSVAMEYRTSGGAWKTAPQMCKDTRSTITTGEKSEANPYVNTYRGSIFWLTTNTSYEVRATFGDADGVSGTNPVTGTVTTWNDNPLSTGSSYYVSATGSDSNSGTEAAPFKTLTKAASVATAGSTVYFKAGTYDTQVTLTTSGTATNYITFRNYGSDKPVFTASLWIKASYIRIKGLIFQNTPYTSIDVSGENLAAGSVTGDIIEDCTIINTSAANSGSCIRIDYRAQNVIIQRNELIVDWGKHQDKNGVYWWYPGDGIVCRNNTVTGIPWDGFGGGPENQFGYVNNNDFYNNFIGGALDDGIQPDGDNINTRVYNNTTIYTFSGVSSCPVAVGPEYIFRNVISNLRWWQSWGSDEGFKLGDGSTGTIYFYHNTVYSNDYNDGAMATNGGLSNLVSRNNVYHVGWYVLEFGHDADAINCDFDYDNLYADINITGGRFVKWNSAKYASLSAFTAGAGQEAHGMSVNATGEFVNAAGGDFRLKAGSKFIDKGVVLPGFNDANSPWPYTGAAPDLGAYEYTATPSNTTPVAANDAYSMTGNTYSTANTALTVAAPGVLANDTDANGDALKSLQVIPVSHGTVILNSNGSFTYTPTPCYSGTDSFTYKVYDGKAYSSMATVTITINPAPNVAPVAVNDAYSTNKDTALTMAASAVLANDTDDNGDTLTAVLVSTVSHGTVTLNSDGSFTYTPAAGYSGTDSFTYKAYDGKLNSNTATVSIIVFASSATATFGLDAGNLSWELAGCVLDAMRFQNTAGTGTLTKIELLFVDTTPNGKVRLGVYADNGGWPGALLLDAGEVSAANGWVSISGLNLSVTQNTYYWLAFTMQSTNIVVDQSGQANQSNFWVYTNSTYGPLPSQFNGSSNNNNSVQYVMRATVNTGGTSTSNTVPVAASDAYSTTVSTALTVTAPGVLSNDTDANGDSLTAVLVSTVSHGTLTLNSSGSFTYTPTTGYTGSDSFTYKANDGKTDSNTATVTITINAATNTAPVAANNAYTLVQGSVLTITSPGVLANVTNNNGGTLTAILVSTVSHCSLTLNTDGSFVYTSSANYTGTDSFTYKVSNGISESNTATVTLTINAPANTAPVAVSDAYSTAYNTALTVAASGVLANDTDANGDTLTAVLVSTVSHGSLTLNSNGAFTYTPTTGYTGTDSFTYKANDGKANSNTATVTITINTAAATPVTGTFGLNSGNYVYAESANVLNVMKFKNTSGTGKLTKLEIFVNGTAPNGKVRLGVYADKSGKPGALLLDAGEVTVTKGWVSISGLNLSVTKNTYYWLAFDMQSTNYLSYVTAQPNSSHYWIATTYGALPTQFTLKGSGANSNCYVIRATVVSDN